MSRREEIILLILACASGMVAWSCGAGEGPIPGHPVEPVSGSLPVLPDECEQGWLSTDINAANYTLRGGDEDEQLGYWLGQGDLDGDGRSDLFVSALGSPSVYIVLGSSLFARPPGEYAIADVADFTLLVDAGDAGRVDFTAAGGALYISPISSGSLKSTYRVPYATLVVAGTGAHPVEKLADATFTGVSTYKHLLAACDLDSDGEGDLLIGEYAVLGGQGMSGDVDMDAKGALLKFDGPAHELGPCTDIDGDGKDDFTAVVYDSDGGVTSYAFEIWYGSSWTAPSGHVLPLGSADVTIRAGARVSGNASNMVVSPNAVGDWDGDGNRDLALEVSGVVSYWSDVLLFLGEDGFRRTGTTLTRNDAALTIAEDGYVLLGRPLALAGDLNGDGRDELVLADHLGGPDEIYVRYCSLPSGVYSPAEFAQVTWAAAEGNAVGYLRQLLTDGDFDGNGIDDVVIGAPYSTGHKGAVLVLAQQTQTAVP